MLAEASVFRNRIGGSRIMNHTSSRAEFGFTRRGFFAATIGVLVASVLPVKARPRMPAAPWAVQFNAKGGWEQLTMKEVWEKLHGLPLEIGDRRVHRCAWEYWDGVTWVPSGEVRCTGPGDGFCHPRNHCHPNGDEYSTRPLPDDRYPSAIWDKNGVQKNPEWEAKYGVQKDT